MLCQLSLDQSFLCQSLDQSLCFSFRNYFRYFASSLDQSLCFSFEITFDTLLAHLASLYFASSLDQSLCFSFEITFNTSLAHLTSLYAFLSKFTFDTLLAHLARLYLYSLDQTLSLEITISVCFRYFGNYDFRLLSLCSLYPQLVIDSWV